MAKERVSLKTFVIPVSIIVLASICTYVAAQEDTTTIGKSMGFKRFSTAENDKYVEIANNLSNIINLKGWTLVVNGVQMPLPEHSLQSGQTLRIHLGKGKDNDANLFLDHAAPLNNTTGELVLKNDTGVIVASDIYKACIN